MHDAHIQEAPNRIGRVGRLMPGLAIATAIALLARQIRDLSGLDALNPVIVALVLGLAVRVSVGERPVLEPGIAFTVRPVLRAAIVLLGLQITLSQLGSIGPAALLLAVAVVFLTMGATLAAGHWLGVDRRLAALIASGTAICGASAVVAANQVIDGTDEDVSYSLAAVTLFGSIAMIAFPLLAPTLNLDPRAFGLWAGLSVHEVVQAVGAAASAGPAAAEAGTVSKLARVVLLAPAIIGLGWWARHSAGQRDGLTVGAPTPWFAFGFLLLVAVGSTGIIPRWIVSLSASATPIMLAASVAALGMCTNLRALRQRGMRPLALGAASSLFIALMAWTGVKMIG